jgi:hypothetical protein
MNKETMTTRENSTIAKTLKELNPSPHRPLPVLAGIKLNKYTDIETY